MTNDKVLIENNRKLWLDSLRGVAMILVVYGHCVKGWTEFFVFTSPVKMPLFFVISAYVFNPRSGDSKLFFKNIFLKLVVPWVVLGMFPYIHPIESFRILLSLWFMPCLIIAETIWFYINKFSKSLLQIVALGMMTSMIGFGMHYFHILHVAMIDTAFVVQSFFVLGILIKNYEQIISKKWKYSVPLLGLIYIAMGGATLFLWPGQYIHVNKNIYYNLPFCASLIIVGSVLLFTLFKKCRVSPRWLVYIGQNTLLIYLLHAHFQSGISQLMSQNSLSLPLYGLLLTSFSILICCLLSTIVNKYLPEVVGKKRKRN